MEHHGWERNAKTHRGLLAVQDTGIAMPAFLGILNLRGGLLFYDPEDIRGTNISTNSAGIAFVFIDHRRHKFSFLKWVLRIGGYAPFGLFQPRMVAGSQRASSGKIMTRAVAMKIAIIIMLVPR